MYEIACVGFALMAPFGNAFENWTNPYDRIGAVRIIGHGVTPQTDVLQELDVFPGKRLYRREMLQGECLLRIRFAGSPDFQKSKMPHIAVEKTDGPFKNILVTFPDSPRIGK